MVRFEQFRHALGQIVGEDDLQTPLPVRIFVFKNPKGWTSHAPITEGRDRYAIVLGEKGTVTPEIYTRTGAPLPARATPPRCRAPFERGLISFFSTFEVNGIRITAGKPPAKPDLDWARIHLMVADPEYYGKIRVLLYNLRHGVAEDPAYRNAFGKSAAEVEAAAKKHFAAGNFQTTSLSSRPMAEADFPGAPGLGRRSAPGARRPAGGRAIGRRISEAARRDTRRLPKPKRGSDCSPCASSRTDEARKHFAAAMEAGSTSARCYIEYAKLEPDDDKAEQALLKAAGINPKLDEPFALMAAARHRSAQARRCTGRPPPSAIRAIRPIGRRSPKPTWPSTIMAKPPKPGAAANRRPSTPPSARRMHQARMSIEQQRLDYEEAEKRREAEEKAREIEKLEDRRRAPNSTRPKPNSAKRAPPAAIRPCRGGMGPSPRAKSPAR